MNGDTYPEFKNDILTTEPRDSKGVYTENTIWKGEEESQG